MKYKILILFLILFNYLCSETIEPLKSKKALIFLPFQNDFRINYNDVITKLKENYSVDLISSADIGSHLRIDITPSIYFDYLSKLYQYDLIILNSHSNKELISLGIPFLKHECHEVYNELECNYYNTLLLEENSNKIRTNTKIESKYETKLMNNAIKEDDEYKVIALTSKFFEQFKDNKSLENSIVLLDGCNTHGGEIENILKSTSKASVVVSWSGSIFANYLDFSTIPFLELLADGKTFKESLAYNYLINKAEYEVTRKWFFGLISIQGLEVGPIEANVTYSPFLQNENNDIKLFDSEKNAYLVSDVNWFLNSVNIENNTKLFFNVINSVHGKHSKYKKIQFYDGHGGFYPESHHSLYGDNIKNKLEEKGYTLDSFNRNATISTDGYRAIFILFPGRQDDNMQNIFSDNEIISLKNFVKNGGSLILVSEHNKHDDSFMLYQDTFNDLLQKLGIEVIDNGNFHSSSNYTEFKKATVDSVLMNLDTNTTWFSWFSNFIITANDDENKILFKYKDYPIFIKSKVDID
jgi:hypothetical protein